MMKRLAAVAIAALVSGCFCAAEEAPIDGRWELTRTLLPPPEGCPPLRFAPLALVLRARTERPVAVEGAELFDENGLLEVHDDAITFSSNELAYETGSGMVIITHILTLVDDRLLGTAWARGGGPQLGCRWEADVVGSRAGR